MSNQYSLKEKINVVVDQPIRFHSSKTGLCTHRETTLNASLSYNLHANKKPAKPTYLSKDDINNAITFLNATLLGKDYNSCILENDTVLPLVGSEDILNINNALQYCTIFKDKCIGITSVDNNNIYWNLISKLDLDSNNFNLVNDNRNTYIIDNININQENFDVNSIFSSSSNSSFNWTDLTASITVIGIIVLSVLIYYYYYYYVYKHPPKIV